jgi:hypothetical protein
MVIAKGVFQYRKCIPVNRASPSNEVRLSCATLNKLTGDVIKLQVHKSHLRACYPDKLYNACCPVGILIGGAIYTSNCTVFGYSLCVRFL